MIHFFSQKGKYSTSTFEMCLLTKTKIEKSREKTKKKQEKNENSMTAVPIYRIHSSYDESLFSVMRVRSAATIRIERFVRWNIFSEIYVRPLPNSRLRCAQVISPIPLGNLLDSSPWLFVIFLMCLSTAFNMWKHT